MRYVPRLSRVFGCCAVAGLGVLIYLFGAASMYFQMPASDFLAEGFYGGEQWWAGLTAPPPRAITEGPTELSLDQPEATYDGYTLVTTTAAPEARLVDMSGEVVFRWEMSQKRPWRRAPHMSDPTDADLLHWERCRVYPNGDILALVCKGGDNPYGYGLAKFDSESRLIWGFSENVHHDIDVGADGRIYTLGYKFNVPRPPGQEWIPRDYTAEYLIVLSPDGREVDRVPLLEAFLNSPYALLLESNGSSAPLGAAPEPPAAGTHPDPLSAEAVFTGGSAVPLPRDLLHSNSVRVLSAELAGRFPQFKAGQVLISFRSRSVVAVLDLPTREIVWATRGPWMYQHAAEFLDNGNLMIFDNLGSTRGSRVLEYNPSSQGVRWAYAGSTGEQFQTIFRGSGQRLPNGNTLIVDAGACRIFEVTADQEVVWQWGSEGAPQEGALNYTGGRRYGLERVPFLLGGPHDQPRPPGRRDRPRRSDGGRPRIG